MIMVWGLGSELLGLFYIAFDDIPCLNQTKGRQVIFFQGHSSYIHNRTAWTCWKHGLNKKKKNSTSEAIDNSAVILCIFYLSLFFKANASWMTFKLYLNREWWNLLITVKILYVRHSIVLEMRQK